MPEEFFICVAVVGLVCLMAALPLAIVALIMAIRALREVRTLAERQGEDEPRWPPAAKPAAAPAPPLGAEPAPAAAVPPVPVRPYPAATAAGPQAAAAPSPAAVVPPHVPPQPPRTAPPPKPPAKPIRWEEWIGLKGLALAGIVVVLIGAALFLAYAHERGWLGRLGPHFRVALLAVAGLGFLAAGEVLARKQFRALARVMTGGGLALEYFTAYSAWGRFHVIPEPGAWGLMIVITAVAILLSVRYASLAVAILSLVGGLAGPLLIRPERDPGHVLFLYLVAVNAGVLVLAYFKKWRVLNLLALAGTILNVVVWLYSHYWYGPSGTVATEKLGFIVAVLTGLWAIYFALSIVYHLLGRRDPSRLDLPVTLINVVAYFTGLYVLLRADHHAWLGPAAAALGAAYLAQGLAIRHLAPAHVRFILLQMGQAIGLATLAIPIQFSGVFIPMAWAMEATVLFWLGLRLKDWRLRGVGLLVHLASVIALAYYAEEAWNHQGMLVLNARTATFAVVGLAMALSAYLFRRHEKPHEVERGAVAAAAGLAHIVLMVLVGVEVSRWHADAAAALRKQNLATLYERLADLAWMRDALTATGLALYGLLAVGLVAVLKRTFHHAMALAAFGACAVFLVVSQSHVPHLKTLAAWNGNGAAFAAVAACLAVAAAVSWYLTRGPRGPRGPRAMAGVYELLAMGVLLGLYVTEVGRAHDYMETSLDETLSERSLFSLFAAGVAVTAGLVMMRGFWLRSAAHRAVGLLATLAALVLVAVAVAGGGDGYPTLLWQPRGVAMLLLVGVIALEVVGYGRARPQAVPERRIAAPVLGILVHAVVLACFTLEAHDFWDAHARAWFPHEELHAWYARHATLSVGYALYAFALLAAGIRRRSRMLRILSLVILGGTLAKVMLLDLSNLEAIWRILSFVGLGLLLLAASLLYHKYRHIIFPPEAPGADRKEKADETP